MNHTNANDIRSANFMPDRGLSPVRVYIVGVLLSALTACTIGGNLFVVVAFAVDRSLRTFNNCFLLSLSLADLTVGVCVMPLSLVYDLTGRWMFGYRMCIVWQFLDAVCCSSSVLNICIIGISRYCAVTRPLAYARCKKSRRKAVLFIVIAWSVAIATSAPLPVTWLLNDGKDAAVGSCVVYADVGIVTYTASVTYFIPVAIMMFVTCTTCWELRKRRRIINVQPPTSHPLSSLPASQSGVTRNRPDEWMPESRQQGESIFQISTTPEVDGSGSVRMRVFAISTVASGARDTESYLAQWNSQRATHRHVRSMVSLVIIAVAVVVCWSPFYCIYVMRPICRRCRFPPSLITGAIWMGYINSTINPLIYAWVNTNFRKSIRKIIGCTFRRFV